MCDKNNCGNGGCLAQVLENIILLQQAGDNAPSGCDKPFLGNISLIANTRPINLYCCCTNKIWEMPYDYNGETGISSFFRIENVNENCATFRILLPATTTGGYTATNNFFVINLNCVGSMKCLADALVSNL